jgi:hypothetical protein
MIDTRLPAWINPPPRGLDVDLVRRRREALAQLSYGQLQRRYAKLIGRPRTMLAPRVLIDLIIWLEGERRRG